MNPIPLNLKNNDLFVALCEALRWWLAFDAAQLRIISNRKNKLCADDVRQIAKQYNFIRNIRNADTNCTYIAKQFNKINFNGDTLNNRVQKILDLIKIISSMNGNIRIVSGVTKIAWFASPKGWTPFDRLASAAVGVQDSDAQVRMTHYYQALEQSNFLAAANQIDRVMDAKLGSLPGTKVLDKLLMMRGDKKWASQLRPMSLAFGDALPCVLKSQLFDVGNAIVNDPACQFRLGASQ